VSKSVFRAAISLKLDVKSAWAFANADKTLNPVVESKHFLPHGQTAETPIDLAFKARVELEFKNKDSSCKHCTHR
jgi:hypothetical protein